MFVNGSPNFRIFQIKDIVEMTKKMKTECKNSCQLKSCKVACIYNHIYK